MNLISVLPSMDVSIRDIWVLEMMLVGSIVAVCAVLSINSSNVAFSPPESGPAPATTFVRA